MFGYIIRKGLLVIPTLFAVFTVVFLAMRLAPGCPAKLLAGDDATPEAIQAIKRELGLDHPFYVQYLRFLSRVVQGDLGHSLRTRRTVASEIILRYPATLELASLSLLLATAVGVPAGIIAAAKRNSVYDNICMIASLFGITAPVFWLGLMLMLVFSVYLGWLPTVGRGSFAHLILPSITLAAPSIAILARMTRSCMLEVMQQDYIRTARSKGLKEWVVLTRHALKNALIPIVTVMGLRFGALLGGAVLTETVFAWPGLGRLLVDAIFWRDYPLVQGGVLLIATTFVIINLIVDILYCSLNPKIRYN